MKKVGILCASDTELEPFLSHIAFHQVTKRAMLKFYSQGILEDSGEIGIVAVYSGVCKVNAAIAAQLLIDIFHVDYMINAGTAGGMDESVRLFDTVISDRMIYHDVADDILTEFHPWLKDNCFRSDRELLSVAQAYSQRTEYPIRFGTMVSGEQFIEDDKRDEINQKYAPLCVDMETVSIAHTCYVNQVPFLSVRTITDTAAHMGIEHFEENCEAASKRSAEIVIGILRELAAKSK